MIEVFAVSAGNIGRRYLDASPLMIGSAHHVSPPVNRFATIAGTALAFM